MEKILENKTLVYVLIAMALYMLVLLVFTIRKKKKDKQFEEDTPDIAKVHLESGVSMKMEDGSKMRIFSEGIHVGYYFEPGTYTVIVSYTYEKLTKRVTIVDSPIQIKVEQSKEYDLEYDRKSEQYTFKER